MILQVGVKVLLKNPEGKVLLMKRSSKYESAEGSWDIPGGRIDPEMPLRENLMREVREETGLDSCTVSRLISAQDIFFQNAQGERIHIVRLTYVGLATGEVHLDGVEHTEHQWVAFDELAGIDTLDPYLKKLVLEKVVTNDSWT